MSGHQPLVSTETHLFHIHHPAALNTHKSFFFTLRLQNFGPPWHQFRTLIKQLISLTLTPTAGFSIVKCKSDYKGKNGNFLQTGGKYKNEEDGSERQQWDENEKERRREQREKEKETESTYSSETSH